MLCSEGKHFCAGADFSGAAGRVGRDGAPHLYDVAIRLFEQPLPIVAAVQGAAIGGGLGLALAADFRVATPESRFSANFSRLGFHPASASPSPSRAWSGNRPPSTSSTPVAASTEPRRTQIGLCDHLVAGEELRAVPSTSPPRSPPRHRWRSARSERPCAHSLTDEVRAAMAHERAEQERLQQTDDFREGVTAVGERRAARFTGR